jgi:hypothetical protein
MKAIKSAAAIALRRDLALLLKRLRRIRREKLASHEVRQRVSAALSEAGSLAQFVAVTNCDFEAQACCFRVNRMTVRAFEEGVCAPSFAAQPADCV